ncbi:MAG: flagellar biosynthetic protein FliO [Pyrinomonadaceae bacterium]
MSGLSFAYMLFQTLVALAFVCGLAYLIFRVLLPRFTTSFGANNMMRVVDRIGLDTRKSLYIIEVTGRWFLVASSESGVQMISELDGQSAEEAEKVIVENRRQPSNLLNGKSFQEKLNEVLSRNKPGGK